MRRRHVVGVHRISSNNALARVALRDDDARDDDSNNDDTAHGHELLLLIVSSNAVEPTDVRRSSGRSWSIDNRQG